jgi:hypothetical protein
MQEAGLQRQALPVLLSRTKSSRFARNGVWDIVRRTSVDDDLKLSPLLEYSTSV